MFKPMGQPTGQIQQPGFPSQLSGGPQAPMTQTGAMGQMGAPQGMMAAVQNQPMTPQIQQQVAQMRSLLGNAPRVNTQSAMPAQMGTPMGGPQQAFADFQGQQNMGQMQQMYAPPSFGAMNIRHVDMPPTLPGGFQPPMTQTGAMQQMGAPQFGGQITGGLAALYGGGQMQPPMGFGFQPPMGSQLPGFRDTRFDPARDGQPRPPGPEKTPEGRVLRDPMQMPPNPNAAYVREEDPRMRTMRALQRRGNRGFPFG